MALGLWSLGVIQHLALPHAVSATRLHLVLYQPLNHTPHAINHVTHPHQHYNYGLLILVHNYA